MVSLKTSFQLLLENKKLLKTKLLTSLKRSQRKSREHEEYDWCSKFLTMTICKQNT